MLMICRDLEELAAAAAEGISRAAAESIAARGRFTLCLSGGSTPRTTYATLARRQGPAAIDWTRTFLFFGDERMVPPDDDRSNFKTVRESLLESAPVAANHVFPIRTHGPGAQQAAEDYSRTLQTFFVGVAWPEFDLALLGLGDDGHTASLFPGAAALRVMDRWATFSPPGLLPPPVDRVTLTFPVFNAARQVMFLVSGANKAAAFADVYHGRASVEKRPAAGIRPASGRTDWLVDQAAAAGLSDKR